MATNNISRSMIVQSRSNHHLAQILLTNLSTEQLQSVTGPVESAPELTPIPLTKSLDKLWKETIYVRGTRELEMVDRGGRNVRIISDSRVGTEYNFVGLVSNGGMYNEKESVFCYKADGTCEEGEEYDLYNYPEERHGWIAIYRGMVTSALYDEADDAIRGLKEEHRLTGDLNLDEVFVISIGAWVIPGTDTVI